MPAPKTRGPPPTTTGIILAIQAEMYVYRLRSLSQPGETYIGKTEDPTARIQQHNAGKSNHTSKYLPWKYDLIIWLPDPYKAARLEKYLKENSGKAFASKHF